MFHSNISSVKVDIISDLLLTHYSNIIILKIHQSAAEVKWKPIANLL